jgi:hypothetical protein
VNPRLVNLLASFIRGSSDYALARLEFSMRFAGRPAPPVLDRLPDASESTLRALGRDRGPARRDPRVRETGRVGRG